MTFHHRAAIISSFMTYLVFGCRCVALVMRAIHLIGPNVRMLREHDDVVCSDATVLPPPAGHNASTPPGLPANTATLSGNMS